MTTAPSRVKNPYPGLRPFEEDESDLFFGREKQTDELLRRLGRARFLAVIGTSGSGKSSLVRAGLLPALRGGLLTAAGSRWRVALLRPGGDPIDSLASALHAALYPDGSDDRLLVEMLGITLRRSSLGLVEATRQSHLAPHENLLIVVDQFEELFRFGHAWTQSAMENPAAAFVHLLLEAVRQSEVLIYVLITMRSDFLGDCAQFRDLSEVVNEGLYLIPRMTRDQLRLAITAPSAVDGAGMAPRLLQQLLNDVNDDPDQLPVLQHALMRTWHNWQSKRGESTAIDLEDYEATGGMAQALSRHADEAWEELSQDAAGPSKGLAKRLFQCLTEKGPDNREVRRPTRLRDLCLILCADANTVRTIIERYREEDRAFLMPPRRVPLDENTVVDDGGRLRLLLDPPPKPFPFADEALVRDCTGASQRPPGWKVEAKQPCGTIPSCSWLWSGARPPNRLRPGRNDMTPGSPWPHISWIAAYRIESRKPEDKRQRSESKRNLAGGRRKRNERRLRMAADASGFTAF
jgi:hypothetical protein